MRLIDDKILRYLKKEGRATLKMISEGIKENKEYTWQRLQVLTAADPPLVTKVAQGVYEAVGSKK